MKFNFLWWRSSVVIIASSGVFVASSKDLFPLNVPNSNIRFALIIFVSATRREISRVRRLPMPLGSIVIVNSIFVSRYLSSTILKICLGRIIVISFFIKLSIFYVGLPCFLK